MPLKKYIVMTLILGATILLLSVFHAKTHNKAVLSLNPAQIKMKQYSQKVCDGEITYIQILHLPYEVNTYSALDPCGFRSYANERFKIFSSDKKQFKRLCNALESTSVLEGVEPSDVRWGCDFYNQNNIRLFTMYLSEDETGVLDNKNVRFKGGFLDWLESIKGFEQRNIGERSAKEDVDTAVCECTQNQCARNRRLSN